MQEKDNSINNQLAIIDYQLAKEEQFKLGTSTCHVLITISTSLLLLIPHFIGDNQAFLKTFILLGYAFVIILGIIILRLDYKQLIEFQKQIENKDSKDYTAATAILLNLCLLFFIFSTLSLLVSGINLKKQENQNMNNYEYVCKNDNSMPTGDSLEDTIIHKITPPHKPKK